MRLLGAQPTGAQASPQSEAWAPLRTLGYAAALIIFLAAVTGYVAFATFLLDQAIFLGILGSALYIADIIAQDGIEAVLKPDARIGARLVAMAGLRRNVLAQISIVLQGVARVVVLVVAVAAVLKPWGVQSQDMFGSLRSAYFGFSLGGVTLSLSSMVGAAIVFAVAMFLARLIQNWLSSRFLPQTRLDAGASNSIRTIFGYVGVIVAALLAGAQIGLDVQKLALIELLFDDERAMIRIDMSEYGEKHTVARLVGARRLRRVRGGRPLTEAVRRQPYCVILLDEVEKAHQGVRHPVQYHFFLYFFFFFFFGGGGGGGGGCPGWACSRHRTGQDGSATVAACRDRYPPPRCRDR